MIYSAARLAWQQLYVEKGKLVTALLGVMFAAVLIFMQLGFRDSLFLSATTLVRNLSGDLFLVHRQTKAIWRGHSFARQALYQAYGHPCVRHVYPVLIGLAQWRNPVNGDQDTLLLVGLDPYHAKLRALRHIVYAQGWPQGKSPSIAGLEIPGVVLFDERSKAEFGPVQDCLQQGVVRTELNDRMQTVIGTFPMGVSFAASGNAVTSASTFMSIFPARHWDQIDVGVIELDPKCTVSQKDCAHAHHRLNGSERDGFAEMPKANTSKVQETQGISEDLGPQKNTGMIHQGRQGGRIVQVIHSTPAIPAIKTPPTEQLSRAEPQGEMPAEDSWTEEREHDPQRIESIRKIIQAAMPPAVQVLTRNELVEQEENYWRQKTSIGFTFGMGVVIGLIVGLVIVYQILFTDVMNHLSEYATLRAIGFSQRYLYLVVILGALWLALLGFFPSIVASLLLYRVTQSFTHIPMALPFSTIVWVGVLIIGMCMTAGVLAARKLAKADPADLF
jgi:hypothetical protein